jgi:hypothetical protein
MRFTKDLLAEALVVGNQDSILRHSTCQDFLVLCLRHLLSNGHNIITQVSQELDNGCASAFINQELHAAIPQGRVVTERPLPQQQLLLHKQEQLECHQIGDEDTL